MPSSTITPLAMTLQHYRASGNCMDAGSGSRFRHSHAAGRRGGANLACNRRAEASHNAICILDGGKSMRNDQYCVVLHEPVECLLHCSLAVCIQCAGGLHSQPCSSHTLQPLQMLNGRACREHCGASPHQEGGRWAA